jgi:hypothetical protein
MISFLLANVSDEYCLSTNVDGHYSFSTTEMNISLRERQVKGKPDEGPSW